MDTRGLIALLYVVAFVMSVVPLITGLLAARSKTASQRRVQPGTIADFNQVFSRDNRRAERDDAPRRASWQLLLVGGGVATGSVASILSLYLL